MTWLDGPRHFCSCKQPATVRIIYGGVAAWFCDFGARCILGVYRDGRIVEQALPAAARREAS